MEPCEVRPRNTVCRGHCGSRWQPVKKAIPGPVIDGSGPDPCDNPPMFRRPFPASLALIVLLAACGSTVQPSGTPPAIATATPAPSTPASPSPASSAIPAGDVDAIFDAIEQQVSDIRGLSASKPVDREFIDRDELRTTLTQLFDEETPPDYLAANERLYKALGLIPADSDLRSLSLDLLSGGVAAFYRHDQGKLYVVSSDGEPGASERFYFSHEYDHALQDQNSTIFADQDGILDQSDRILARQAIYEGDATLLMSQWAAANLDQSDLLELLGQAADPEAQAVMARTPPFMVESLTFPYTTGLGYVSQAQSGGGWPAVDAYFDRMPESTEQILHPEKYTSNEPPVVVTLPVDLATDLGKGWSVPLQDTFGEFQIGTWLRQAGVAAGDATTAAAGWGGDRLAVMTGPDETWAVAMETVWDTPADAAEFEAAAGSALAAADGTGRVLPGTGGKTRWVLIASDAPTLGHVAGVLGLAG
jgi:hypothetical protein